MPTPEELYERHMVPALFAPWAQELVTSACLQDGECVLDVATGTGIVARFAALQVGTAGQVFALDNNPLMLAVAAHASESLPQAIQWSLGSADHLPYESGQFDIVLCQQGLQFFPDRSRALKEINRVLRPGGRIAVAVWASIEHAPAAAAMMEALRVRLGDDAAEKRSLPFSLGHPDALHTLAEHAGFTSVHVSRHSKTVHFPSVEAYVRQMLESSPVPAILELVKNLGDGLGTELIADIGLRLKNYTSDAGLDFPQDCLFLSATKAS